MKLSSSFSISALIVAVSICSTALAHDSSACDRRLAGPVEHQARIDRWYAQRANIQILEKRGESLKNLTRAYRSLIEDLFDTDAEGRKRIVLLVLPSGRILNQLNMNLPARRFSEDLIRAMSQQMGSEMLLAKLREFAEFEADKLIGY